MLDRIRIFAGSSNPTLAQDICRCMGLSLGSCLLSRFSDGEIRVEIHENVRGADAYVVQSTCRPVNENLMELLLLVDALKRASAARVTAVIPYYGYARRDQKNKPRVPITAKMVANLLTAAGVDRIISCSLHAGQIQGFFKVPVDDIPGEWIFADELAKVLTGREVIVAPDAAGVARARIVAERFQLPLAIIHQEAETSWSRPVVVGEVRGRPVVIFDDMVVTGRKLCRAARAAWEEGAVEVVGFCVHPVLSEGALERIGASPLRRVVVTDTIPLRSRGTGDIKMETVTVAPILARVIEKAHEGASVSELFT
ncbi:ribose-phosphate pyrophosphokinase [Desulfacinum hydrothermale DSM 13146]|uniref:Ribose-phosphate pyrophosphokinase n=1 Tax=Desulfacinum hydrothermale DSM 13146 TaxID=1121390 RepID=A0A1W1XCM6_9BACT|nr:ribose-phosphate diphosphokinase [Desulfacinum hydrothermale]SMC21785.1 ribose-phosphate pyrophosphokinase [Desulfacinum hydrothermale DSM 13146]